MLGVAFVGALIVFTVDARREAESVPEPETQPDVMRWLILSAGGAPEGSSSWTNLILGSLSSDTVELVDLSVGSANAIDLSQRIAAYPGDYAFDLATIWVGPEDLLAGSELQTFELILSQILRSLATSTGGIVVGNIPNLTPELVAAQLAKHDAIKAVIEQWNSSIARLTTAYNGTLADFSDPPVDEAAGVHWLQGTTFAPDEEGQREIARRFAVAMTEAVERQMNPAASYPAQETGPS
jgi:hypothetical protein